MKLLKTLLKPVQFLARTEVFFALLLWLMLLLIAGTLAQKDIGLYAAQTKYFNSFYIIVADTIPLPSGYTIMGLIFTGLLYKTISEKWKLSNLGTLVIHLSILMLLFGGFITSLFSSEGNMVIEEGMTRQYINDYHKVELVIIEQTKNGIEKIVALDNTWLKPNHKITHKNIPFNLNIITYYRNALVEKFNKPLNKKSYHTSSKSYRISSIPLEIENELNQAAMTVKITTPKSEKIYTLFQDMPLKSIVKINDKIFRIELRNKRTYLPFKVKLNKFTVDRYANTNKASSYSSDVLLRDGDMAWRSQISMNEPVRYKGYTLFQSSYIEGSSNTTVLAVVNNVGRLFPYISSILLCIGLLIHLFVRIPKLIRKSSMAIPLLFLLYSSPANANGIDISTTNFKNIPVLENGRIKPIDTFARHKLLAFNGKDSLPKMNAINWLAETLFDHKNAYQRKIFNIPNPSIINALELKQRDNHRYSFKEIVLATKKHLNTIKPIEKIKKNRRTLEQNQILNLYYSTVNYYEISRSFTYDMESQVLKIIPEQWENDNDWFSPWEVLNKGKGSPKTAVFFNQWQLLSKAYKNKNALEISTISKDLYKQSLKLSGNKTQHYKLKLEAVYNSIKPFKTSLAFYILSLILLMLSTLLLNNKSQKTFQKISFYILSFGAIIHGIGIISRMVIMERPPVTTLYESILFVSLISIIFSIIFERRKNDGMGIFIGTVLGSFLQFLSLRYSTEGDTLGMLEAVLNTNFWLATHVVTITIGYGCCLVAGLLGHIYLVKRFINPNAKKDLNNLIKNMLGATLIALFFSVLGTILGGIWADQSWGRFWGWDPKENGAMLICMWLVWLLHGRITGTLKPLYFGAGIALTNVIVALAWFGVNLLGIGLHSYGFTNNILLNLAIFCSTEFIFICSLVALNIYKIKKVNPLS